MVEDENDDLYVVPHGGGRQRDFSDEDDLYVGLLICEGHSQRSATFLINGERASAAGTRSRHLATAPGNASQQQAHKKMSQQPSTMRLQARLHQQLTNTDMPKKATKSVESQLAELQKAAANRTVLLVLDGDNKFFFSV